MIKATTFGSIGAVANRIVIVIVALIAVAIIAVVAIINGAALSLTVP